MKRMTDDELLKIVRNTVGDLNIARRIESAAYERAADCCQEVRQGGSSHKPYEGYDDGFADGCNESDWAIRAMRDDAA